jgi:hypothetical protein
MNTQTYISPDLADYINKCRTDNELIASENSTIADAMCGLEITITGLHVDDRTSELLRRAMSVISTYHWVLEMMQKEK